MLGKFINIERLIHSIKTVIACLIGLLSTRVIGLAAEQWVIITILVVMCAQIYVGSVMQKAYLRFLGTLLGCLFAAATLLIAGSEPIAIAVTMALSSFIFSYIGTKQESYTYAATLGAVTTAIIMLGQQPTLLFALERFLEISFGLFIATMVSQFVLPIHASVHLRRAQALTLDQLSHFYKKALIDHFGKAEETDYHELDEEIVKSLLMQRQLAKESARERLGPGFSTEHFMQSLYAEREILRSITFMHNALIHNTIVSNFFAQSPAAHLFNDKVLAALAVLTKAMAPEGPEPQAITLPSLKEINESIAIRDTLPSQEEMVYIDGFLFSAGMLTHSLATLANLYRVPLQETTAPLLPQA